MVRRRRRPRVAIRPGNTEYSDTNVGTGHGDDRVDSEVQSFTSIYLGSGDDEFTGTSRFVYLDGDDEVEFRGEAGCCTVEGEAGDQDRAVMDAGTSGNGVAANKSGRFKDVIDLGMGGSARIRAASFGNPTPIDLGPQGGYLDLAPPALPYVIDDAANTMTYQSQTLRWTGSNTSLYVYGARGLTYRGTARADVATLYGVAAVSALGGDDVITMGGFSGDTGTLAGGTGDDVLMTPLEFYDTATTLNLGARTLAIGAKRKPLAGFERYHMASEATLTMLGSAGDDVMTGASCRLVMRGGPGNDLLTAESQQLADGECVVQARQPRIYGGDHGDRITVSRIATVHGGTEPTASPPVVATTRSTATTATTSIDASAGRDTVYGGRNVDTCRDAEVKKGCER